MRPLSGRAHFGRRLACPVRHPGRQVLSDVFDVIGTQGVTWIHCYVAGEGRQNFCVYDSPNAEAIRATAERNGLPVDPPSGALVTVPAGLAGSYRSPVTERPAYALGQVSLVDFDADGDPNLGLLHGREAQQDASGGVGRC
jgi:hypothetical protein